MIETLTVSIIGPALSFLLYENSKCKNGQEGFLLGKIIKNETKSITDNDQRQVTIARLIKIDSVIPCPNLQYFYNGIGKIDEDKIRNFLGDEFPNVVAWFKYKPACSFKLSFREKIVHKQLAELFNIPKEFFSFCLLINERSDNLSTHLCRQYFVRINNNRFFDQLPLRIVNLSDPNNSYKTPEPVSDTFKQIVDRLKIDHKRSQGLTVITKIQNSLQKHVDSIVDDLAKAEARLYDLENEIGNLKELKSTNGDVPNGESNNGDSHNENQIDSNITTPTTKTKAAVKTPTGKKKVIQIKKKSGTEIEPESAIKTRSKH